MTKFKICAEIVRKQADLPEDFFDLSRDCRVAQRLTRKAQEEKGADPIKI